MKKILKITSWNVNGLRACYRKDSFDEILSLNPDILCLQETKTTPDKLPENVRTPKDYFSYFASSKTRQGYSGAAIFSKEKPKNVVEGMGIQELDQEGRLLTAYYKNFVLINVYFPNGGGGPVRLAYKLRFYESFFEFIEFLRKKHKNIIFCGDINTAHKEIDLARPKENENRTGFLPIERSWIDKVVEKKYVDVFRYFFPNTINTYTYWDMKTFARNRNVGWRIDYFFVTSEFIKNIKSIEVLSHFLGSDHCPLSIEISV